MSLFLVLCNSSWWILSQKNVLQQKICHHSWYYLQIKTTLFLNESQNIKIQERQIIIFQLIFVLQHLKYHKPCKKYYVVPSISFQTDFVQAFKIVIDSWKFSMLLQYILWDDWPILMISGSNEQLQQQLEYIRLKPDCHSWWILKMQSGRQDTLEKLYAIKLCFKLGKNATETYGMLQTTFQPSCINLSGIRDLRKAGSLWEMMRGVGGVRKSEHQSWLAKGLGLGLLCWGFKGVQEEIPWEEASTLQIGSVAFPPGQFTSPQLHPCHRLFEQDGHQDSSSASL